MRVVRLDSVPEESLGEATPIAGWTGGSVTRTRQTIIPDNASDDYRCSVGIGYGRVPFGELGRAERGRDALVGGMRAGAGIGRQLRQHAHVLETGVTEALIEAAVRAPFGAGQAVRERGDFQLQLGTHGD